MPLVVRALRGATTIEEDVPEHIGERVAALVEAMFERNGLGPDDVVSMLFSATPDIHSTFPATVARLALGLEDVPLMNCQELDIAGALPRCIRVMAHVHTERARRDLRHVFLEGASVLRPDLAQR
ncbi:MAG: chorismate mutase [Acidimicrobiia bacterium]|nr:chorismate mutase [Acidimicrobiia bacterium]